MSTQLLPCPSCARHVRTSEVTCPFCASALATMAAPRPLPRSAGVRLSRAAMFVLGTSGAAAALGACGEVNVSPFYGGPPYDAGPREEDADPPFLVDAAYGGPPQDAADASADDAAEASDASDAGDGDAEIGPAPAYGGPP